MMHLLRGKGPPRIVGHRGALAVAPENTLPSFERAWRDGADLVELDVRLCAGGDVVVMHDSTVDRTTSGVGRVAEMTLSELKALDAGAWFGPAYRGARVPALEEVLVFARGKLGLLLELKYEFGMGCEPALAPRVVDLVRRYDMVDQVAVISYRGWGLDQMQALLPGLPVGPLPPRDPFLLWLARWANRWPWLARVRAVRLRLLRPLHFTRTLKCNLAAPSIETVTPALVQAAHALGMPVSAGGLNWNYPMAIGMGVDTVAANDPGEVRRLLDVLG
ncbi:MAG: hypothetical protein JXB35_15635 [Anaerolineae bacterium]|nr:hypothetical protein [Anaerolineae bacterium]